MAAPGFVGVLVVRLGCALFTLRFIPARTDYWRPVELDDRLGWAALKPGCLPEVGSFMADWVAGVPALVPCPFNLAAGYPSTAHFVGLRFRDDSG